MSLAWEEVPHTADWALKVRGIDLRSLFENAARGMVSLIGGQAGMEIEPFQRKFALRAPDLEMLLVDWLTELLILIEEESAFFTDIHVDTVAGLTIEAHVTGRRGGNFSKHIKAVTYHDLSIRQTGEGFETIIVFDV